MYFKILYIKNNCMMKCNSKEDEKNDIKYN